MFGPFKKSPEPPIPEMPTDWPPVSVAESGPRPVRFTGQTIGTIQGCRWMSILAIAIGIPLVLRHANRLDEFVRRGQVVQATVENLTESHGKSTSYYVHYGYSLAGTSETDRESVPYSAYAQLHVGDRVPVTALPDRPQIHRYGIVGPDRVREAQFKGSAAVMAVAGVFAIISLATRAAARGERAALEGWRAAPAQAIKITKSSAGKSGTNYAVTYRVLMPDGQIRIDDHQYTGADDFPLKVGQFFTTLLDPEHIGQSRPRYSFKYVELEAETPHAAIL